MRKGDCEEEGNKVSEKIGGGARRGMRVRRGVKVWRGERVEEEKGEEVTYCIHIHCGAHHNFGNSFAQRKSINRTNSQ